MSSYTDQEYASASTAPHNVGAVAGTTRKRIHSILGKSHFVLEPSTVAAPVFDAVPRNASFDTLRPILARLPPALHPPHSDDGDEEEDEGYGGDHSVMYTRSRLASLDQASVELWRALHSFRPLTPEYASGYAVEPPHPVSPTADASECPVFASATAGSLARLQAAFNWSNLTLRTEVERVWYGVLFLSLRKRGSESLSFYEADRQAHEEATRSGGLLMYWYGAPHPTTGANLATCIWTSRTAALAASRLPLHKAAAIYAAPSYERYDLVRYKLTKRAGDPQLHLSAWTRQDDLAERR
ncbi:hypothetical protein PaG_05820 [Moesziomyces aphidis]|jgi:hypothetical protein|uniref:Uncharacterized protein n=1 Tax=Moesziomyces aphidis TaxID=84754 RepID=W3VFF2_MOEAP|nr:hypothetical protein PaG_05820 [Moesziomyces aphidis]